MKRSVIAVEDHRGVRNQIVGILNTASDIACVGMYASAEEALPNILDKMPDVVLMDINLPCMSGIECASIIKRSLPSVHIIMITTYNDSGCIFSALKAGADSYFIKSASPEALVEAVRDVFSHGSPMSSAIARKVLKYFQSGEDALPGTHNLSNWENEVLKQLSAGLVYEEIAEELKVSGATVRGHIKNICRKMHISGQLFRTRL